MGGCWSGRAVEESHLESHEDHTVTVMLYFRAVQSIAVIEHVSSKLEVIDSRSCQQDGSLMDTLQGVLAWAQICAHMLLQLSKQTCASGCLECEQRSSDWAGPICGD